MDLINTCVTLLLLLAAVRTDLHCGRIRNRLILTGLAAGTVLMLLQNAPDACLMYLAAAFLPVPLFWGLFRLRFLGAGDIKLMCVLGLLCGLRPQGQSIAAAFLIAAVCGCIRLLKERQLLLSLYRVFTRLYGRLFLHTGLSITGADAALHRICFAPALLYGYILVRILSLAGISPAEWLAV